MIHRLLLLLAFSGKLYALLGQNGGTLTFQNGNPIQYR
jgi:hypothetical protein